MISPCLPLCVFNTAINLTYKALLRINCYVTHFNLFCSTRKCLSFLKNTLLFLFWNFRILKFEMVKYKRLYLFCLLKLLDWSLLWNRASVSLKNTQWVTPCSFGRCLASEQLSCFRHVIEHSISCSLADTEECSCWQWSNHSAVRNMAVW